MVLINEESPRGEEGLLLEPSEVIDVGQNAERMREAEIRIKIEELSTAELLEQIGTPQNKAFRWLTRTDDRRLAADDPGLAQRYILAVLWFATKGASWRHSELEWLSPRHECEWTTSVRQARLGVLNCKDDKITRLHLGEIIRCEREQLTDRPTSD